MITNITNITLHHCGLCLTVFAYQIAENPINPADPQCPDCHAAELREEIVSLKSALYEAGCRCELDPDECQLHD